MRTFIEFLEAINPDMAAKLGDYDAPAPVAAIPGQKRPMKANRKFVRNIGAAAQNIAGSNPYAGMADQPVEASPEDAEEQQAADILSGRTPSGHEVPAQTVKPHTPWRK